MNFAGKKLDLHAPHIMGILNITPDSFSDGGELFSEDGGVRLDKVLERAEAMQEAGASFLDIGGESTRPGAKLVSEQEELERVLPVVEAVKQNLDLVISVDTSSPSVILASAKAGAGLINDVRAMQKPGAVAALAQSKLPVCLMHMQGRPDYMQNEPRYTNVVEEVVTFLEQRIEDCIKAGVERQNIIIDPGFGFGKNLEHNLELLSRLSEFKSLELPILVGLSRKRMLGAITGKEPKDRKAASLAAAVIGFMQGASIVRTHDVAETVDAMKFYRAVRDQNKTGAE